MASGAIGIFRLTGDGICQDPVEAGFGILYTSHPRVDHSSPHVWWHQPGSRSETDIEQLTSRVNPGNTDHRSLMSLGEAPAYDSRGLRHQGQKTTRADITGWGGGKDLNAAEIEGRETGIGPGARWALWLRAQTRQSGGFKSRLVTLATILYLISSFIKWI